MSDRNTGDDTATQRVYVITVEGNNVKIAGANHLPLKVDDCADLISIVRKGIRQRRHHERYTMAQDAMRDVRWVFPTSRRDTFKSGPCVYFITCDAMPDLIKIGQSAKLSTRMRTFYKEYGCEMNIRAFAKTEHSFALEQGFHLMFDDYRVAQSEWFDAKPVLQYLRDVMNGMAI